ncbi:MAG: hypothetical protein O3A53_06390 [Acidobacteria bacterium]|nr:hypothetical protein [Acidobacteriota bacterium]MDA1234410.1 hypothetical protein [Acidobacteriota bacterium]
MPELIDAYERQGHFYGTVQLRLNAVAPLVEFGLTPGSYRAMKKILSLRPFDAIPGLSYRFFFAGAARKDLIRIRVELDRKSKQLEAAVPPELSANLEWLISVDDPKALSHLRHL